MNPTVSPTTKDDLTLTCQRCKNIWQRRNLETLPKSCPRCGSRYWQKPLTPYWESYYKEKAAFQQAQEQQRIATKQEYIQTILNMINQPDSLKIYYCPNQASLEPIKDHCTNWLPENTIDKTRTDYDKINAELYQLGHTIATTAQGVFPAIKGMISKNLLPHNKVFFIKIEGSSQYIYSFNPDGTVQKFWGYQWPPQPPVGKIKNWLAIQ